MIDDKLIRSIDLIKEKFSEGTMTINNWYWNGNRGWSGVRTIGSPYYSKNSQHSKGKAIDAIFNKYSAEEIRKYILKNPDEFPDIGGIELDVNWLHIDVRDRQNGKIVVFNA